MHNIDGHGGHTKIINVAFYPRESKMGKPHYLSQEEGG